MFVRLPNQHPKYTWHWWAGALFPMVIGVLLGIYGLIRWIASGFTSTSALICTIAGIVIFFAFRYVKSLDKEYEEEDPERKDGGAP